MRCATSRSTFTCGLLLTVTLCTTPVFVAADNACPSILPTDVSVISEPRLCRTGFAEGGKFSVCHEYGNDRRLYQVVFRGGTAPKAVYERVRADRHRDKFAQVITRRNFGDRACNLQPPPSVPTGATYRGTGVCEDEQGRPLPCSLFEHAGARQPEAMRYFVYYAPDGSGIRRIDALPAGHNEHALEAELAFHLGQALSRTVCCGNRAKSYLAHAAALFPDDGTYRAAVIALLGDDIKAQSTPMAAFRRMLDSSP